MKDKKVTINPEKCMKCGLCSRVCPMQINVHKEARENNLQVCNKDCIKCGYCVDNCPMNALEFKGSPETEKLKEFNKKTKEKLFPAKVINTKFLSEDIKEITLKYDENVNANPGDYILINVDKEIGLFRAYSISWIKDKKTISFIVKKIPDGLASEAIFELKKGDEIKTESPKKGEFSLDSPKPKKNLCFIAAGIGVTPFIALTKKALEKGKKVTLFHSSKLKKDLIYLDFFNNLKKKYSNFNYIPSLTRENPKELDNDKEIEIKKGRITNHLPKYNLENNDFFICGQKSLVKNTEKIIKKNFSNYRVREESFD